MTQPQQHTDPTALCTTKESENQFDNCHNAMIKSSQLDGISLSVQAVSPLHRQDSAGVCFSSEAEQLPSPMELLENEEATIGDGGETMLLSGEVSRPCQFVQQHVTMTPPHFRNHDHNDTNSTEIPINRHHPPSSPVNTPSDAGVISTTTTPRLTNIKKRKRSPHGMPLNRSHTTLQSNTNAARSLSESRSCSMDSSLSPSSVSSSRSCNANEESSSPPTNAPQGSSSQEKTSNAHSSCSPCNPPLITLRTNLTPNDIDSLKSLHKTLFPVSYSYRFFQNLVRHPKIYTCVASVTEEDTSGSNSSPPKEKIIGVCSCRVQEVRYFDWINVLSEAVLGILQILCCCCMGGLPWILFGSNHSRRRYNRVDSSYHESDDSQQLYYTDESSHNRASSTRRQPSLSAIIRRNMHSSSHSTPPLNHSHSSQSVTPNSANSQHLLSQKMPSRGNTYVIRTGYIMTLGVMKPYRRRGLASKMLKVVMNKMEESFRCHQLMLHCKTDNTVALEFYKKAFGFEIEKKIRHYYMQFDEKQGSSDDAYQLVLRFRKDEPLHPQPRNVIAGWISSWIPNKKAVNWNTAPSNALSAAST